MTNQTFLGHPKGLFYLFFAELWERFSFYGMRALLTLYMTQKLLYSDEMSFGVYAAYMSLVYMTPLIGGMLADRVLGYRKAIIMGGIFMAFGHFFLSIETPFFFFTSLALIIVGNGLFKPNISTFVGLLYHKDDTRRDSGFTIFYMGINLGGAIAPLLCAWLASVYGWHYGFMAAGFGMLSGLFFFYRGLTSDVFGDKGNVPNPDTFQQKTIGLDQGKQIGLLALLSVPLFALLVRFNEYEHYLVWLVSLIILGFLLYIASTVTIQERKQLIVIVYFTALSTLFWAIFEQAGSSLTLFADRNVNLIGINAAQTNSINSTFIILLALPFSFLWTFLNRKNWNPNSAIKFGLGLVFLGLGFLVFARSASVADAVARTPMIYLILGYFIYTVGELFLSPIGLSKMTELSPKKYLAFVMGVWFCSNFYGHYFAGKIANLTAATNSGSPLLEKGFLSNLLDSVTGMTLETSTSMGAAFQQLYSYVSVYALFGFVAIGVGVLAVLISPFIRKLMGEVR
ncbi:MAG: MFS transporter [Saprospiraceae bacterium]|nr:MAG: MFS transporter [Saprospiraceae bacterium]